MIELTDLNKEHIASMAPDHTKIAYFQDDDPRTNAEKLEWME